ncbi:uncharacterized protein N7484_009116 [Penicillium longicatenatum]|uniref:uncharacterized protein n=1 Tax=Penicillium longicatenatum TaxID=1561947 RepID=UPI002546AB1E|nr:uncharacterized protein N7484_009116 [Penicillium longicatenatum]KAJ5635803.1 hypothetical protein N7484_009116 [Penicillium longicatenatum]
MPPQVPRYTSRGWSRARTRSQPREERLRNPAYLIVEEAKPGERPRVTRYSPGRAIISPNYDFYNGDRRNRYRSNSRPQLELEPWNRLDTLRSPEGVITKEAIYKWANKAHPNGSGWEALSHSQKKEHPPSHHDEKAGSRGKDSTWRNHRKDDQKKESSWKDSDKGENNAKQPRGSTHSPKKNASIKDNNSGWSKASKKVTSQQGGNRDKNNDKGSNVSDWGNPDNGSRHGGKDRNSKSGHDNKKTEGANDPDTWVSTNSSVNGGTGIDRHRHDEHDCKYRSHNESMGASQNDQLASEKGSLNARNSKGFSKDSKDGSPESHPANNNEPW